MAKICTIKCGYVNCYLIVESDSLVLVDAGNKGDFKRITRQIKRLGFSPEDISLIFLTHGHMDHVGSANRLREQYDIPIAMAEADVNATRPMEGRGRVGRMLKLLSTTSLNTKNNITPDILLEEGIDLTRYGLYADVLSLQGHTQGSMALLFDDGKFIAGDIFMNMSSPSIAHIAEDYPTLEQSVGRLKKLHPAVIYPGHGKPFGYSELPQSLMGKKNLPHK